MAGVQLRSRTIHYYGNPAGFMQEDGTAVVDLMFQNQELNSWLGKKGCQVSWQNGVYDRIASGQALIETPDGEALKSLRIHQMLPSIQPEFRYLTLDDLQGRGIEPMPEMYHVVYDGGVDTNNLEEIYRKFRFSTEGNPPGFQGNPMSRSDVVELYDESGSAYYYNDDSTFLPIPFGQEPEQGMAMQM